MVRRKGGKTSRKSTSRKQNRKEKRARLASARTHGDLATPQTHKVVNKDKDKATEKHSVGKIPIRKTVIGKRKGMRDKKAKQGRSIDEPAKEMDVKKFCFKSSLDVSFLVFSDRQLVSEVPAAEPGELQELLLLGNEIVKQWETGRAVLLTDFEGEFTGFEGELTLAAFVQTYAIDRSGLRPQQGKAPKSMGLVVDMGSAEGITVVKRLMESAAITKVIWGADGDLTSLHYTPAGRPLGIRPVSVVDAQLGYSTADRRVGMAKMLERVPEEVISRLPTKVSIDFDTPHSRNRRAMPIPYSTQAATYAADDLHRLEAILRTQKPNSGSYTDAQNQTQAFSCRLQHDLTAIAISKMRQLENSFMRSSDLKRMMLAVRVKRCLLALRIHGVAGIPQNTPLEQQVDQVLLAGGVQIPQDLSFAN